MLRWVSASRIIDTGRTTVEAERFDFLARSLPTTGSRRRALTVALAGAVSTLGRGNADAKKKRKKKKSCPVCEICTPPQPTFCATGSGDCQASGPRCICTTSASGARACVAFQSLRGNVLHCGACTGNGEICVDVNAAYDVAWCAIPCAAPR
jgi:hypothetical protein